MWAMIPILRVRAMGNSRMGRASAMFFCSQVVTQLVPMRPHRSLRYGPLPAVMGEGLVRLGHLVHIFSALYGCACTVGGVEHLVGQPLGHRLLSPLAGESDQPPDGQGGGPTGAHLHGHLVGGATD